MASSRLNRECVFTENRKLSIENVVSVNMDFREKHKVLHSYNIFNKDINTLEISLFVGLNSEFTDNQILNSNFYSNDEAVKSHYNNLLNEYKPFNELKSSPSKLFTGEQISSNTSANGNIETLMNPLKIPKTYGSLTEEVVILGDLFEISNDPFEEMINLENIDEYFKSPRELVYPRYYNIYSLSRLNSNISIFGTIESIDGSLLTEVPLKGMNIEIITNGIDSRNRQIFISNKISIRESQGNATQAQIEGFSDQIVEDLPLNNSSMIVRNYSYENVLFNGQNIVRLNTGEGVSSRGTRLTNNAYYYNEDELMIVPFDDSRVIDNTESDIDEDDVFSPTGQTTNNIDGGAPDSFAYSGEND